MALSSSVEGYLIIGCTDQPQIDSIRVHCTHRDHSVIHPEDLFGILTEKVKSQPFQHLEHRRETLSVQLDNKVNVKDALGMPWVLAASPPTII